MSAGQGEDAERFAAALEHGSPPGADAGLRRELEIVAMLRSGRSELCPEPAAKARAKQRLLTALAEQNGSPSVSAADELTAPLRHIASAWVDATDTGATVVLSTVGPTTNGSDSDADVLTPAVPPTRIGRRAGRHHLASRAARRHLRRSAGDGLGRRTGVVTAAAAFVLMALTGAGTFASRDSLPGDALYGVKRVAESASLAVTFNGLDRGRRHLEQATTRLDEVERLVAPRGTAVPDAELVQGTILDFDTATGEGSRLLLAEEETAGNTAELGELRAWAAEQAGRLATMRSALPGPAVAEADDSIALLDRVRGRAEALQSRSSCTEVVSGVVDDLGPLPAEGVCAARPDDATGPTEASAGTSVDPSGQSEATGTGEPAGTGTTATSEASGTSPTPTSSATPGSGGGLQQLGVDGNPLDDVVPRDELLPNDSTPLGDGAPDDVGVPAPLPLLPTTTLPPLLPGLPGLTVG